MKESESKKLNIRVLAIWAGVCVGVLALLVAAVVGAEAAYSRIYHNRIFPGVRVLDVRLDGLTKNEARQAVQKELDTELGKGLRFRFNEKDISINAIVSATDPDISRVLVNFNLDPALDEAFDAGRGGSWLSRVFSQMDSRVGPTRIPVEITLDEKAIEDAVRASLKDDLSPAKDATFSAVVATGSAPFVHIENERSGMNINMARAFRILNEQAARLSFEPISIEVTKEEPKVFAKDIQPLVPDVMEFLNRPNLTFTNDSALYRVTTGTVASWLTIATTEGERKIVIDEQRFGETLRGLAPSLEQTVINGSLVVQDGKIISFVPGTQGSAINVKETLEAVLKDWPAKSTFPIEVMITSGSILGEDPERLGIKEIIGVGTSNFSGSPTNRRKNIRKGAEKVNGSLIAPGEEFSLLKTLGVIDGENGWLPELVIKGNETKPEFGGGLCQIGTTTFRAALNSGLDITMRQNHSYRVRYYEPAGTDATIYDPMPDFRFINDTGHHILINTYIKGDNLIFEVWGTKDGRTVDPIKSRVYNIVAAPPMKLIETLELPPGKKKCTETAHAGADAEFTYHIVNADGTIHDEVFKSHYRPWQAVCLIGVETLSNTQASSTTEVTPLAP